MSAHIFKKLRKPGYAPTLIAGMLSNIMVFAEPVSRATTNLMSEKPIIIQQAFGNSNASGFSLYPGSGLSPLTVDYKKAFLNNSENNEPTAAPGRTADKPDISGLTAVGEYFEYYAAETQGAIGVSADYRTDNGRDNYFTVMLPETISTASFTPVLVYKLHGLADAASTTKSINGSPSYGGAEFLMDDQWKEVEEYLPVTLLKPGKNEIFFTRRTDTEYQYHVKDVRIQLHSTVNDAMEISKEAVGKVFNKDSFLESKTFSFDAPDESMEPFYALQLMAVGEEFSGNIPDIRVLALPFKDIKPLDQELVNVTSGVYQGYRVSFGEATAAPVQLQLEYDPEIIPEGYSSKDIRTFIYDKNARRWKALPVEDIDRESKAIISLIEDPGGEADYINGIIKAPEHPETAGFTPTMLTDIEFANPAAGVVSIAPPSANNTGAVTTGFPIKLSPGRNGMQPSLEVAYNSDGGNGWMGMGWDLSIPAITLNTKWGVPLFDPDHETELYSLSGQDLVLEDGSAGYTAPHRDADLSRNQSGSRQFYLRKEGSYLNIIRHGNHPNNYRWEVTDKFGNKSYYGGIGSVDNNAVLRDGSSRIAHWALVRQEDPYGNYIEYNYHKNTNVTVNGISGQELYIQTIKYTLHPNQTGNHYQIDFNRDSNRSDVMTSARNGFIWITKDRLKDIQISFIQGGGSELVRSYEFEYGVGPFNKQQLAKISERDSKGNLFYSNTMEYFGMSGTIISNDAMDWEGSGHTISSTLHSLSPGHFDSKIPKGTALGASESDGFSAGLRVGAGFGSNPTSVSGTVGGSRHYKENTLNTRISFIDINGDGLPDKVFSNGNGIYYLPNTGSGFGNPIQINGRNRLGQTKSWIHTTGFDANIGIGGIGLGVGYSDNKNNMATDHYFIDFNGDGLPDMVSNNRVWFNITQANGDYTWRNFNQNGVNLSENPIDLGEGIDPALIPHLELETLEELREQHPQYDHVKVWRVPYDGNISITSQAQLIQQSDCGAPQDPNINGNNHFRLTVERAAYNSGNDTYGQTSQLGSTVTLTNTTNTPNINRSITGVKKGDLFFFRIHNLENGCGGKIEWNPVITYTASTPFPNTTIADENGKQMNTFDAEGDFMMNNGGGWTVNEDDTSINIVYNLENQNFNIYDFSDDIRFVIQKNRTNLSDGTTTTLNTWTRIYKHDTGDFIGQSNTIANHTVGGTPQGYMDSFRFYAESDSNVAWDEIGWQPTIFGNESGIHYPPVNYSIYDDNVQQQAYWYNASTFVNPVINDTIPGDGDNPLKRIHHNMFTQSYGNLLNNNFNIGETLSIKINWVIKEQIADTVRVVHKRSFYMHAEYLGTPPFGTWSYKFTMNENPNSTQVNTIADYFEYIFSKDQIKTFNDNPGSRLFAGFYIDNKKFGLGNNAQITLSLHPNEQGNYTFNDQNRQVFMAISPAFFGLTHRGWGQFLYSGGIELERDINNDNELILDVDGNPIIIEDYGDSPININVVDIDFDELEELINNVDPEAPGQVEANASANRLAFYGQDNEGKRYTNSAILQAIYSHNGNSLSAMVGRFGLENIFDIYVSYEDLTSGSSGTFIGIKQRSKTKGSSLSGQFGIRVGTESIAKSRVLNQYIDLNGNRYPDLVTEGLIQYSGMRGGLSDKTVINGFSAGDRSQDFTEGVTISPPHSVGSDNGRAFGNKTNTNSSSGINESDGFSYNSRQWVDINGDGLPDQVTISETDIRVRLNTGYGFTNNEIVWGSGYSGLLTNIRDSDGIGGSFGNASFSVGFGGAESTANFNAGLIDVNGDGLPDLVIKDGNNSYKYYLNTGTGFGTVQSNFYNGTEIIEIEEDISVAGNVFGTFTFGFGLVFIPVKITFTVSAGFDASVSEKTFTIQDIDGDGLPDILEGGDNNGSINAHLNRVGKTHLLKKVNTPLGGSWEVDYERAGNTYNMPQNKWVMSRLETHDGFTGDNAFDQANSETLTTFIYRKGYHDRRERDFFGFETVNTEQRNPTNGSLFRYTEKSYHNKNYYLNGAQKEMASYTDGGVMLSSTRYFYNLQEPGVAFTGNVNVGLDAPFVAPAVGELDRTRAFPALVKSISTTIENGQALNLVQEFIGYDDRGNITQYINPGSGLDDAYRTEITYSANPDFRGLPTHIKVFKNSDNTLMREREADYNNQGKLELITTHLGNSNTNRVELVYNAFGNTIEVHQLDNLDESGTSHFVQEIEYDPVVYTYPVAFNDSYGQSSSAEYDLLFGIPVFVTDMNDNSMRTRIDNRGRVIEIAGPNEYHPNMSDGSDWIIRKQYKGEISVDDQVDGLGPNDYRFDNAQGSFQAVNPGALNPTNAQHHAVTRHNDPLNAGNEFLTVSMVDGFGQAIQLKKKHVMNGNDVVWQVGGYQMKDAYGRVVGSYLPGIQVLQPNNDIDNYTSLSSVDWTYHFIQPTSLPDPVEMVYDDRDRQTQITQPGETQSTTITYGVDSFMGMSVTSVINELGQTQDTYTDVRGRQRKVVQNNEITTEFFYNPVNELIKVKNHAGYETTYAYDQAGRRTHEFHPDRGLTTYSYDNANRLIEKITSNLKLAANNDVVTYHYDYHRLVEIDYPQFPDNKVSYVYGAATTQNQNLNAVGRLVEIEDATGIQLFQYNRLGGLINQMRSIAVAGKKSYWFSTSWEYDSWNRVSTITYPDQETVSYHYDPAGQLKSISTNINSFIGQNMLDYIVTNITYTEYGERKSIEYGNGTITNYNYDLRRRLDHLNLEFASIDIDKQYTYDPLSNITSLSTVMLDSSNNNLPVDGHLAGPSFHTYDYDNYNRLISASGYYVGPDDEAPELLKQAYTLDMTYDLSHNILSKNQVHQFGSVVTAGQPLPQGAPHAPTSYSLEYEGYAGGTHFIGGQGYVQPHAPRQITEYPPDYANDPDDPRVKRKMIDYDANGNMTEIREQVSDPEEPLGYRETAVRKNLWDEEDRLRAMDLNPDAKADKPEIAAYTYNAGGERTVRYLPGRLDAYYSARDAGSVDRLEAILYPNSLVTVKTLPLPEGMDEIDRVTLTKYTNHYYIGSERVASALGFRRLLGLLCEQFPSPGQTIIDRMDQKVQDAGTALTGIYTTLGKNLVLPQPLFYERNTFVCEGPLNTYAAYWYHPDHLGSSSYITNLDGEINQHMEYLPFGELLVEEHLSSYNSPFKFSALELDSETGNYYASNRYYNPKWSIWLSTDLMSEFYPGVSPYNYVLGNPVNLTDRSGLCPDDDPNCPDKDPTYIGKANQLDEVVVRAYTKDRTGTSEAERYGYSGDAKQYQQDYPEFAGMSDAQMMTRWTNNYSSDWNEQVSQWDREAQAERLMEKLWIFKELFITAGAMGMGAMASSASSAPASYRVFQYTMRYQNTATTSETVFGYYGTDASGAVRYIGISNNPFTRFKAHLNSNTPRASLDYQIKTRFDTRLDTRIWEQQNINNFGLKNLFNQRNEIRSSLWGKYNINP